MHDHESITTLHDARAHNSWTWSVRSEIIAAAGRACRLTARCRVVYASPLGYALSYIACVRDTTTAPHERSRARGMGIPSAPAPRRGDIHLLNVCTTT